MKLIIIILFQLITILSYSQDGNRLGIRIGYHQDLNGLKINSNDYISEYQQYTIGIEWVGQHLHYKHFVLGMDFGLSNHSNFDSNSYLVSLHTGKRTYFKNKRYFRYFGIVVEYDFNAPDDSKHLRQNGIGTFFSIGREITLKENRILQLMPIIRISGIPLFNKGAGKEVDFPLAGGIDWGIKFSLQTSRYDEEN